MISPTYFNLNGNNITRYNFSQIFTLKFEILIKMIIVFIYCNLFSHCPTVSLYFTIFHLVGVVAEEVNNCV